jgi:predicted nucleic acid-binding protein
MQCTEIIDCTTDVAEHYAKLKIELQSRGAMIPINDIWIAACCIAAGQPIATRDAHFQRIPDLTVEMW